MAAVALSYGAATALTFTGLATLANATSLASSAYVCTTNKPLDVLVEVVCTVGTVASNKQYIVYAVDTLDATNFSDTSTLANMRLLGTVQTGTNATAYRSSAFSIAQAFGGVCPPQFKVVVYNDSGAAFTAGTAQTVEVAATVV